MPLIVPADKLEHHCLLFCFYEYQWTSLTFFARHFIYKTADEISQELAVLRMIVISNTFSLNLLKTRRNGHYFPDDIFKCICLNKNLWIIRCNFTEICSLWSNCQYGRVCSDNVLATNRRQAIIWSNVIMFYWRIYPANWRSHSVTVSFTCLQNIVFQRKINFVLMLSTWYVFRVFDCAFSVYHLSSHI